MFTTPVSKTKESKAPSPSSVTSIGLTGEIILSPEALNFIKAGICSEEDPCLIIHWTDGVMDSIFEAEANQILNLPQPPLFLDTTSPE